LRSTSNRLLYAVTVLIWGSTWIAIKFQLGEVAPEVSIFYRLVLASTALMAFVGIRSLSLRFSWRAHFFIALQGVLLFSVNYYLVYLASLYLPSGLAAVTFSLVTVMNNFFGALFLGNPIRPRVLLGAVIGLAGLTLVFWPEFSSLDLSNNMALGLGLSLASVVITSLGNITSARNQRHDIPVVQANALGMAYGAVFMLGVTVLNGSPFNFEWSVGYVGSMLFLSLLGSAVAFGTYLTLLGRIGPDRAAYVVVLFPIVALAISTAFEDFVWTPLALAGVALVLVGNAIVLTKIGTIRPRLAASASASEAP